MAKQSYPSQWLVNKLILYFMSVVDLAEQIVVGALKIFLVWINIALKITTYGKIQIHMKQGIKAGTVRPSGSGMCFDISPLAN